MKPLTNRAAHIWNYQLQVTIAAVEMITDPNDRERWLHKPCPQLGGRVPLRVAWTKRGTAEVLRVLKYWPGPEEGLAHLHVPGSVFTRIRALHSIQAQRQSRDYKR